MLRKALLVVSGNALASLLSLVRNLIIARLIPLEDFGIAATFAILISVIEMISAFGLQQQIIQARDGDAPRFQAALQGFQVLRGVISAAVLFLFAGAAADFMNLPEMTWAYRLMALVPLLNAFQHFDMHRLTREMRFWPMMLTGTLPVVVSLAAIWPLARMFGDWRVMLWALLIQAVLTCAVSHLVAERPYRLVLDRALIGRSLAFGWPLLLNNVLLFGVFNGDRLIVGRELGMADLAIFSMGITLTLTPTLVLARSLQNLLLPGISAIDRAAPDGEALFRRLTGVAMEAHLLIGIVLVVGAMLLGPGLIHLLLGEKYTDLSRIIVWLAAMQGLRIFKGGPSIIALARGRTENAMIANLFRVGLLPLAWWIAMTTQSVEGVILVAIEGETAGYAVSFLLLRWRIGISLLMSIWKATRCAPVKKPSRRKLANVAASNRLPVRNHPARARHRIISRISEPTRMA